MNKKILLLVSILSILIFTNKAQAQIAFPFFNINITEHTVGGDGTFNFHISYSNPPDGTSYPLDDFSIDTLNGNGTYSVGDASFGPTTFYVTQDQVAGWQSPDVVCSSSNPLVTSTPTANGVNINAQGFSSIDCDITNKKVSAKTPVLIIPGVMGTDLWQGSQKLWLDIGHNISDVGDQFMDPLKFNSDLTPSNINISLGNVLSKVVALVFTSDYSDGLIQEFKNQGYTQGATSNDNLFLFPYDWRYGVSDSTVTLLEAKIDDIRHQTGSDKVDIVAHSTGGLLVKKYVMDHPTDNHIGKAVFVGVPNTGAPKAIKVLLQGDNFGNPFLADSEMKKLAENFPVVYDLSPSQEYFNNKGSYIETIDSGYFTQTKNNLDFNQSNNFLTSNHSLNSQALTNAHNLHTASFDNFDMRTAGVDLYAIDGCKAGTLSKVIERRQKDILGNISVSYDQPTETPGDGTVPLESATNLPINNANKYFALKASHGEMLSQEGIKQEIVNLISGSNLDVGTNRITQDISQCKLNGKAISIYSPLSIEVTDQDGRQSGLSSDGVMHNDIPNADFQLMGDHKFIYLPTDEGQVYSIKVTGTGDGDFTLKNANINNNLVTGSEIFSNIPVTTNLTGTLNLGAATTMSLDTNGDGSIDSNINPSSTLDANQSEDLVPPITTSNIHGRLNKKNGYYKDDVSITLAAIDPVVDGQPEQTSGLLNINYNLDNTGYKIYSRSFHIDKKGLHTLKFFSTDRAGNNEGEQSINFTIGKNKDDRNIGDKDENKENEVSKKKLKDSKDVSIRDEDSKDFSKISGSKG
ncbi:MAG: hypothetical protein KGI58_00960 [Patescibacteria group bacterium]|nr:hypothetical protein [Patescibacteria group bacterium]